MTSTDKFQIKQDFYLTQKDCIDFERKTINTNPRYKNFNQVHFTAGDEEQFQTYRDKSISKYSKQKCPVKNIWNKYDCDVLWEKYQDIGPLSVDNTFNYIFHKFKKGIFIRIRDNKLTTFLPFSKKNFVNEWSNLIQVEPKYKNIHKFIEHVQKMEGRKYDECMVNKFTDTWYANNCLVRWEYPIHEGDTNVPMMSDMFKNLCLNRNIPDIELFVNCRDFPLITKNETEPYNHIYGENVKLKSHNYDKYCPILSMVSCLNYADIAIPNGDDWSKEMRKEGKFFPRTSNRSYDINNISWNKRKSIAVFRGSSSGSGVTPETNNRLKLAILSKNTPPDTDGQPLLDAGITDWNLRPRKNSDSPYLKTIEKDKLNIDLVSFLTIDKQTEYKYVVNVDGHSSAYRLSLELESGFCVLLVESKYRLWFRDLMKPYQHYIPVKEDLSDLLAQIKWCKDHDKLCEKISLNAKKFAEKYLSKNGMLDYLQKIIFQIKNITGDYLYNIKNIGSIFSEKETEILNCDFSPNIDNDLSLFPRFQRSYGFLEGISWVLKSLNEQNKIKLQTKQQIFKNNSTTITESEIGGINIINKSSKNNLTHEAFICIKGTNQLLKQIPNFSFCFCLTKQGLLFESLTKQTLSEYINSEQFNMEEYLFILIQIALALQYAQNKLCLVHNDLTPWNVLIIKLPNYTYYDYPLGYKKVYRVKTKIIPVIIDMEKSHIISDFIHHGSEINRFLFSTIQDIITILNTSIYEICKLKLKKEQISQVLKLINFVACTGYHQKKFTYKGYDGLGEVRFFLTQAKKFTSLINNNKHELENKNPIDFVEYITTNFNEIKFNLQIVEKSEYHLNHNNPRQVFNYSFSHDKQSRLNSFIDVLENIQIDDNVDKFTLYYTINNILESFPSIQTNLQNFITKEEIKTEKNYEKIIQTNQEILLGILNRKIQQEIVLPENNVENIFYDEKTFLFPEKILEILKQHNKFDVNINYIIQDIINKNYKILSDNDKKIYLEYYNQINYTRMTKYITDLNTIRMTANILFDPNPIEPQREEYKKICQEIINIL
jgi:hypothetical protein